MSQYTPRCVDCRAYIALSDAIDIGITDYQHQTLEAMQGKEQNGCMMM